MEPLSSEELDLINQLYGPEPFWRRKKKRRELFRRLTEVATSAAIASIAPFLIGEDAEGAARAIDAALSRSDSGSLPVVAAVMRRGEIVAHPRVRRWRSATPEDVPTEITTRRAAVVAMLASFHGNGYAREKAVSALATIETGEELPFLLLRLSDWVPQVRDRAKAAIAARLTAEYAPKFVPHMKLISRLFASDAAMLDQITAAVAAARSTRDLLIAAMNARSRDGRRMAFRILTQATDVNWEEILHAALNTKDPVIGVDAVRLVTAKLPRERALPFLEGATRERSPWLRREALAALSAAFPAEAEPWLIGALLDRHASVRDLARFELGRQRPFDFARHYREALATTSDPAAVSGLGETGLASDARVLLPFLSHPVPRVRRVAAGAVLILGGAAYVAQIMPLLRDPARSVSLHTARRLRPYAASIGPAELRAQFASPADPHVRRSILALIAALPKWDRIALLLRASADPDAVIAAMARVHIERWNEQYNRPSAVPTRAQLDAVEEAVRGASAALPRRLIDDIAFSARSFR